MVYDVMHCANLLRLIGIYVTEKSKQRSSTHFFEPTTDYMKRNLSSTIKTKSLADTVFMEETYFIKKFKKAFGISPITYLNKLRIYKSMTLLAKSDMSLSEICHKVGICDASYFSKLFKANCGITPGEYRSIFNEKNG